MEDRLAIDKAVKESRELGMVVDRRKPNGEQMRREFGEFEDHGDELGHYLPTVRRITKQRFLAEHGSSLGEGRIPHPGDEFAEVRPVGRF